MRRSRRRMRMHEITCSHGRGRGQIGLSLYDVRTPPPRHSQTLAYNGINLIVKFF